MKTVLFEQSQLDSILDSIDGGGLKINKDILASIANSTTFFGNCFNDSSFGDNDLVGKIVQDTFDGLLHNHIMSGLYTVNDVDDMLSEVTRKCVEIETPIRETLEKICMNFLIDTFNIPDDLLTLDLKLCDKITLKDESILIDPIDGEFSQNNSQLDIDSEINKRKLLLALSVGCGMCFARDIDSYCKDIPDRCEELVDLYKEFLILNTILLFLKNDNEISDKNTRQIGCSVVKIGNSEDKTHVCVQAKILPVLITESIRGLMELFISHGLPDNNDITKLIIGKTDFIKGEPWLMRVGPRLWSMFAGGFGDVGADIIPYIIMNISMLNQNNFNKLVIGSLNKNKEWKAMMKIISNKSKKDSEYFKFVDKMSTMQTDKEIIMDDFIHPDEI